MKWWQKKVRGWTVPFWYTDTPLISKRVAIILSNPKDARAMARAVMKYRRTGEGTFKVSEETRNKLKNI